MSIRVGQQFMSRGAMRKPAIPTDAFRKSHEIEGSTVGAQTDYQVKVRALYDYSFPDGRFYDLSDRWSPILGNPTDQHGFGIISATNIVEVNLVVDGSSRKYLAYSADSPAPVGTSHEINLYYSDDLEGTWTAYSGNPILNEGANHCQSPSAAIVGGTIHLFNDNRAHGAIERWTSADGINFVFQENVIAGLNVGAFHNCFIWLNPNDDEWYLYWKRSALDVGGAAIMVRHEADITNLAGEADVVVIAADLAWPTVMYRDGKYWLLVEVSSNGAPWKVSAYSSDLPTSGFTECDDSPILINDEACPHIFLSPDGSKCYLFTNRDSANWYQDAREILATSLRPYEIGLEGNCKSDFGGVRFTAADGETELDYWMESEVDDDNAVFWVEIPTIPASPGTVTIYMYYGRADATTTSDADETFPEFFDHFPGAAVDGVKWNTNTAVGGTVGVAGSILTCSVPDGVANKPRAELRSKAAYLFGDNYAVRARATYPSGARRYAFIGFSNYDDALYPVVLSSEQGLLTAFDDPTKYVRTANLDVLTNTSVTFTVDAYAVFEARRTAASFVGVEDDRQLGENTTNLPSGNISIVLGLEAPNLATASSALFDWALIRKYVDPEPAHGDWGAEEGVMWPF